MLVTTNASEIAWLVLLLESVGACSLFYIVD